jgi:DHA1 family bicyclomycin/chloramphenicol resistance-like MFS transporter
MTQRFARNAIVLGLLSAIGPFAIDMYLPALPSIAVDFKASTGAVQMSLMAFFIAVGLCQVIYGPVSDMLGRKAPLYFGLSVFAAASIGAALAPSIEWLIFFRFIQGIGACAGMVIPRAIVRDLHTGPEAARLMSLIMLVFSVSPILAPLTGSALTQFATWHYIFLTIGGLGLLGILLVTFFLKETRPAEKRIASSFRSVLSGYGSLLRDWHFLGLTFIGGLGLSSFFAFIATSSFVYIDHFGLTPAEYSVAFSLNAVGFIGSAQFAGGLARRFGLGRVVKTAVAFFAAFALVLLAGILAGIDSLPFLMAMLAMAFACLGLVIPSTAVLALEHHGPIAGMASALLGTLQLLCGAMVIGLVSSFFNGTALPMALAIASCSVAAFILSRLTLRQRAMAVQPAE